MARIAVLKELRSASIVAAIPCIILLRQQPALMVLVGVVAILSLRTPGCRLAVGTLLIALALGAPWIVAPLLAGTSWLIFRPKRASCWLPMSPRWLSGPLVLAVLIGVAAGFTAWLPVASRSADYPPVVDVTRPPVLVTLIVLVCLALGNAVGEEVLWRGAFHSELTAKHPSYQYLGQAASFGLAHLYGLPGGLLGVGLASVFALACTWLRRRYGLGHAILAHFAADVVMFTAVMPYVVFTGWSAL